MLMTTSSRAVASTAVFCVGILAACGDPRCPPGYEKDGDLCRRIKDAGSLDASSTPLERGEDDDAGNGPDDGADRPAGRDANSADSSSGAIVEVLDAGGDASNAGGYAELHDAELHDAEPHDAAPSDGSDAAPVTCASRPCQNGGTCAGTASGFACNCPTPYTGDTCELEICLSAMIRTQEDLDMNLMCAEIRGDLNLATAGLADIVLPNLRKVSGDILVSIVNNSSQTPVVRSLSLPKLQSLGGSFTVQAANPGSLETISLPALEEVKGAVYIAATDTKTMRFPELRSIAESMTLMRLYRLCTLELRRIVSVGSTTTASELYNLPASALEGIKAAAGGSLTSEGKVGCCYGTDNVACSAVTGTDRAMYCGC